MSPDLSLWIKNNLQIQENYNIQIFDFVFLRGRFCFPNGALQSNCSPKKEA